MTNWPAIELLLGSIIIGACVNFIMNVLFHLYKKKPIDTEAEVLRRDQHERMWRKYCKDHGMNGG